MRPEIKNLNDRWDEYISRFEYDEDARYELSEEDVRTYSALWADTFIILRKEWKEEMVRKDLALLLATIGSFIEIMDSDGNAYGSEDYERVTNFTMIFITNMVRYDYFRFDPQGNLLLDTFDDKILKINPETFELPSFRGILGLE